MPTTRSCWAQPRWPCSTSTSATRCSLSYGTPADAPLYIPPTPLVIVGTATFPAVGFESFVADHTSMGTGALFSEGIFPPAFQRAVAEPATRT